jgi:hypothetical protein
MIMTEKQIGALFVSALFLSAQAEIRPSGAVNMFSPDVKEPVAARYGWFDRGEVSLFNGAELPAAPFFTEAPRKSKQPISCPPPDWADKIENNAIIP